MKWRLLTSTRVWEFENETKEDQKAWINQLLPILNPEMTFGLAIKQIVARDKKRGIKLDIPYLVIMLIEFLKKNGMFF